MGYRGKVEERAKAEDLRRTGWTVAEICAELRVSRSSASLWCRDVEVDPTLLDVRRRARWEAGNHPSRKRPSSLQVRKEAEIARLRAEGAAMVGELSERDLLVAEILLYAGEGSKTDGVVKLTNSDPRLVRLHLRWMRHFFAIDEARLRVRLYLHDGLDLDAAVRHWSEACDIPPERFTRPYRAAADASRRHSKYQNGIAAVVYSCSATHRLVMGMIDRILSQPHHPG